jgi:hypothetical protein
MYGKTILLATVSALALAVSGQAMAQAPSIIDLGTSADTGYSTPAMVLENLNGVAASGGTNLQDGVPVTKTYGADLGSDSYTAKPNTLKVSNDYVAGYVLTDNSGNYVAPSTSYGSWCSTTAKCTWVAPTVSNPYESYKWVSATYANAEVSGAATGTHGTVTEYLTDANGKPIALPPSATVDWTTNTITGCPTCKIVASTDPLPSASYVASGYEISGNMASHTTYTPAGTNKTSSQDGGVVYSHTSTGNTTGTPDAKTTVVPTGIAVEDSSGNTSYMNSRGVVVTDGTNTSSMTATTVTAATGNFDTVNAGVVSADTFLINPGNPGAGNVGQHLASLDSRTAANSASIVNLKGDVKKLYGMQAATVALPTIWLDPGRAFAVAGGAGFTGDNTGFGMALAGRMTNDFVLTGSFGISDNGDSIGKVGGIYQFGGHSSGLK